MEIGMWAVIAFALIYEPIIGYFGFQKFKKTVEESEKRRISYYVNVMTGLWVPTIFILLLIAATELTLADAGLAYPTFNTDPLGAWITYSAIALLLIYFASLLYYLIGYRVSEKIRSKWNEASNKELGQSSFSVLLPVTGRERKVWNYVSITAGVTEEIIYRGFLIFAFSYLFPDMSIWAAIVLASVLFGLAHSYQGLKGVIKTMVVGIWFSILAIGLGSIVPLIILHFLIDYVAKLGDPVI